MNKLKKILIMSVISFIISNIIFADMNDNQKSLEVAFYEAGFLFNDEKGIDLDVILELEKRIGVEYKHSIKPRARIWHELSEGLLPMSVSGIETKERLEFARFVPYIAQKNKVVILKDNSEKYRKMENFINNKDAKIAVVRGFRHGEFYDEVISKIEKNRINEVPAVERLFFLLKNKRVDLIISLPVFYRYEFRNLAMGSISEVKDWDTSDSTIIHGLVLSKKFFSEEDYQKISGIILNMREDGTLERIFSKYLPKDEVEEALRF